MTCADEPDWQPFWLALLILTLIAVVSRSELAGELTARFREHGPRGELIEMRGLDNLRSAFNDDAGTARLVLLLSPT